MSLIFKINNLHIIFEGALDETIPDSFFSHLEKQLHQVLNNDSQNKKIDVDFSNVVRGNSIGIINWLKFIKKLKLSCQYNNSPPWLVQSFSLMPDFFTQASRVKSILVPYYNAAENKSILRLFTIGKDIPSLKDNSEFQFPIHNEGGLDYEADVDPRKYLHFLSWNN